MSLWQISCLSEVGREHATYLRSNIGSHLAVRNGNGMRWWSGLKGGKIWITPAVVQLRNTFCVRKVGFEQRTAVLIATTTEQLFFDSSNKVIFNTDDNAQLPCNQSTPRFKKTAMLAAVKLIRYPSSPFPEMRKPNNGSMMGNNLVGYCKSNLSGRQFQWFLEKLIWKAQD